MELEFGLTKSKANALARGLPFEMAAEFDFDTALIAQDIRKPYPEVRYQALGYLADRVHVLVFTETTKGIRVISLRKANKREIRRYEEAA